MQIYGRCGAIKRFFYGGEILGWKETLFKKSFLDKQNENDSKYERNILLLQVDDYKIRVYKHLAVYETVLEIIKGDNEGIWLDRVFWHEGESMEYLREKIREGIDSCNKIVEYNKIKPVIEEKQKEEKERNLEQLRLLNGLKITLEQL